MRWILWYPIFTYTEIGNLGNPLAKSSRCLSVVPHFIGFPAPVTSSSNCTKSPSARVLISPSHIHIVVHPHVLHPESIDKGPPGPQFRSTFQNPLILAVRRISMDNPQGRLGSQAWARPEARSSPKMEMVGIILRMIFPFSIELDKMKAFGSCDCKNLGTEIS